MKFTDLKLSETEASKVLRPMFEHRIFHVTQLENLTSILKDDEIRPNKDYLLKSTFGFSSNSFFRKRNCVSVFDLASPTEDQIEEHIYKCWPTRPLSPEKGIAILLLFSEVREKLLTWDLWKESKAWEQHEVVVPHVEAGHPGPINLRYVDEVIRVEVYEDPNSLAAIVRRAHKRN